jgi:hypothetical protein
MVEGIIGFSDMLSIAQTIGIVGTMVLTLLFSRKQLQSLSIHDQTRVLNDLDEKVRKMAEIIIERATMQKVIYKLEEDMQRGYQTPNQYKVVFLLLLLPVQMKLIVIATLTRR